ncbi:MAG: efflux RND transporter permease subunit [Gammaproteobacteria bacterium]|nr:efflux RND transporter permease subunit [Gammaproteobacteria bacterium]
MNGGDPYQGEPPGPIAYMASNGVAANLLMLAILAAGLVSLTGLEREAWSAINFYTVEVSMAYPGANPEEIEESIVIKIEDQVSGLEDVNTVRSVAAPGIASVRVEMNSGVDMAQALNDVESAVARIQTFPTGAERPEIREMTSGHSIIRLILYGDMAERSLKELAHQIEDEFTALPEVSLAEVSGVREYEISIEVPGQRLRALGLTLDDIANIVRANSLDLSAGSIDTSEAQVRVRTLGQRYVQQEFEDIVVVAQDDGTVLRLGDIATVRDEFQEVDIIVRHRNQPAVFIEIYRSESEQIMNVATAVYEQLAGTIEPSLPEGVGIDIWNDESTDYSERAALLLKNGSLGLLLVFFALALFLQIRLAIWVTVGLATAFVGALAVMLLFDVSINTVSLFVFVLAIGIIVDDAIVTADSIYKERKQGLPGVAAAIRGTRRIKIPLTFAVLTSIAAFIPLLFIPGGIGDIWRALPIIVIGMLVISLVESLFILPAHLSHLPGPDWRPTNVVDRFFADVQGMVDRGLQAFVEGPLDRGLKFTTAQPLVVVAGAVGALIVSVSLLPAGLIAVLFADVVEGDFVTASLEMPDGTTAARTWEVARELEASGLQVIERLSAEQPDGSPDLLDGGIVVVGQRPRIPGGGLASQPSLNPEANLATVEFKLISAQDRGITTTEIAQAWRDEVGILPHVRGVVFSGDIIDLGNPIEAILSHPDPERLVEHAESVVASLRNIEGVFDIRSDHTPGVREMQLELRPEARTFGLNLQDLALQARTAFFGAEALRVQRGGEEVRVYARLPEAERNAITDIEEYIVRTPSGAEVPLRQVASMNSGNSPPAISRRDEQRVVTVAGDIDIDVISAGEANGILTGTILANLMEEDPELSYILGGEQQVQADSLGSLFRGFALAMLLIFALLAIPLRSYTKPFIIMSIIPFGLIGVMIGHFILQVPVSATTIMGVLGLSGVIVNDSLVMVDLIDQKLRDGMPARNAVIEGAKGRFRPILLTSVTTFMGFTPLILDRSIQAQFMMPFAASLGIGILITTFVLMLVVPAISTMHLNLIRPRRVAAAI